MQGQVPTKMLCQSYEVLIQHSARPPLRWKEWIPLVSQQLRLRNLVQIIAFNISHDGLDGNTLWTCKSIGHAVLTKYPKTSISYYYTLHMTTMSAPFYTSEKLEKEHPKWSEIDTSVLLNQVNGAVNGIIVRLWAHCENKPDCMITMWGVYFNGLHYLGPTLNLDKTDLELNSIIFKMQGGYFTAAQCLKERPRNIRCTGIQLNDADVKNSYKVNSLLNLQTKQQSIKKHLLAAQDLREKIAVGGFTPKFNESSVLQRLLNDSRPKAPKRQELLKARQAVELARFQVEMLTRERNRKQADLLVREKLRASLSEENMDRGLELMSRYQNLHKDIERLKEWKKAYIETRETYVHTNAQLAFRRKQLIAELNQIYPIVQLTENKFSICNIHLPNSDNFNNSEDVLISVALGFVAHVVQMISIFLQVPLRYPIIHFSSRSKIIDYITDKIPDNDREFPLFLRGRDRLQFNYGVYLLNKNIAQLRFYCGMATRDLPATLPNLLTLLLHKPGTNGLEFSHRSMSGSSLDLRSSSTNVSPIGSLQAATLRRHISTNTGRHFEKGHRSSKSMGSSELKLSLQAVSDTQSADDLTVGNEAPVVNIEAISNNLSFSLDKGLDEYGEIKKGDVTLRPLKIASKEQFDLASQGFVGSEPILTPAMHDQIQPLVVRDEAQKQYLQKWQAGGGLGHVCSDDDYDPSHCVEQVSTAVPASSNLQQLTDITVKIPMAETLSSACMQVEKGQNITDDKKSVINVDQPALLSATVPDNGSKESLNVFDKENKENSLDFQHQQEKEEQIQINDNNDTVFHTDSHNLVPSSETHNGDQNIRTQLESIDGISDMLDVDNVFANVTSRTEALASRNTSFNRVRSRHSGSGSLDEGHL